MKYIIQGIEDTAFVRTGRIIYKFFIAHNISGESTPTYVLNIRGEDCEYFCRRFNKIGVYRDKV